MSCFSFSFSGLYVGYLQGGEGAGGRRAQMAHTQIVELSRATGAR